MGKVPVTGMHNLNPVQRYKMRGCGTNATFPDRYKAGSVPGRKMEEVPVAVGFVPLYRVKSENTRKKRDL
jgi:hypothetical protein